MEHADAVRRQAAAIVGDGELAADICQEAFARLLVVTRSGRVPARPVAWVARVAHNLAISEIRRRRTRQRLLPRFAEIDPGATLDDEVCVRDTDRSVARALGNATEDDLAVLMLAAQGYRSPEIAARVGRSEGATRTLLCRARRRLRDRLESQPASSTAAGAAVHHRRPRIEKGMNPGPNVGGAADVRQVDRQAL